MLEWILDPHTERLRVALAQLRHIPGDLGEVCQLVYAFIRKGGKLARRPSQSGSDLPADRVGERPVGLACQAEAVKPARCLFMSAVPASHRIRPQHLRGGWERGAGQSKGFYWRSKTSLAFTCPVSTSWIAELTSSSWRRS